MAEHYILIDKQPVIEPDFVRSALWAANFKNRVVKQTHIGNIFVSTVFLGVDYSLSERITDKPILFETMVFNKDGDSVDQRRYCTWEEAEEGHEEMIELIKGRMND